ncbi:MAG: aldehyde ferredoxin oxidoreductase C-terminal domain-containing protein [Rectinemataceae bacterium]|nr:aldehyde ferredoxin oxidoreductase C-terminal domain-containing protein [Rectinemataceae bacterium]
MDKILRVDTRKRRIDVLPVTEEETRWGGRGLIAHVLLREVPPTCEPTGRRNKLIFASGLLADTNVTTVGQMSIGGKSPLTGGARECNIGGGAGRRLARLGVRALIIEDTPTETARTDVLEIRAEGSRLVEAPELKGKLVDETIATLREKYGAKVGIFCVGPAGEMMLYAAGIACPDDSDVQIRYAGRGGLGALMGSKGIKAIVVDDAGSTYKAPIYDKALLQETSKWMTEALLKDPKTENRNTFGTPAILALANSSGLMPTRNFSSGSFEKADDIAGERVREEILARGGQTGKPCVTGCVIQCSNLFPDKTGKKIVASLQYETISLLGSNCGIGSLDDIAELNHLCNQVGVDSIETGAAIGVAMEAGVIPFGDAEGAKYLIRQMGQGTWLGRIIGHGAKLAGRVLGVRRIPVIKGQAIPGYDPRGVKGNGVTYITSPMGADHTAGNAFETLKYMDVLKPDGQVEISRKLQIRAALLDTLGLCLFVRPPFVKRPEQFGNLLKGRYGWDLSFHDVQLLAWDTIRTEREFNERAGVSEQFFPIPEFMEDEPLPPKNAVFDVKMSDMVSMWDGGFTPLDEF